MVLHNFQTHERTAKNGADLCDLIAALDRQTRDLSASRRVGQAAGCCPPQASQHPDRLMRQAAVDGDSPILKRYLMVPATRQVYLRW
jgi:hypothetical protein